MSSVSVFFAILFYAATAVLLLGLAYKIKRYASIPAPLKIPTMPAPITRSGVVFRMFREVAFFESLFKSNKWIWLFGILFHLGMLLVLLRHFRYFTDPVWLWVDLMQPFGIYASYVMLAGLLGLLARRFLVDRVRYITSPSDIFMLLLLISIAGSGVAMRFVWKTDIIAIKGFFLGLLSFNFQSLPSGYTGDTILIVHLSLVASLMLIFAFSKLLHAPGVFFSPTRNQVDNSREKRHVSNWALQLDAEKNKVKAPN
ncbi:MAG: respiratory nitrate reductase subunit gamma [Gammaproteobacteria bacterium]